MLQNVGIYILGIICFLLLPWWVSLVYFVVVIFFTDNDLFVILLALLNDMTFAPHDHFTLMYFKNTLFVLLLLGIKFLLKKFTRVNFSYDKKN